MVVDGIRRMNDVKLGRGRVEGVDECEQETVWRARKLSTFEATAPAYVRVTSKHTPTGGLQRRQTNSPQVVNEVVTTDIIFKYPLQIPLLHE